MEWEETFHFNGSQHLYCSDPLRLFREGKRWYMQEMTSTLIVTSLISVLLFWLRNKQKKKF